jgi:DNA-binding MarR family transcriptional regulator
LIERTPGPGRAVHHRLTARGQEVRRAGAKIVEGVLAETIGTLSRTDLAQLHRLLLRANS